MIFYKNKNQSAFIPSRLIFRGGKDFGQKGPSSPSAAKAGPVKLPPKLAPLVKQAPTPAPTAQSGIESLKIRLQTAGLDERRKLSLDILTTAQANQDKSSIDFARAEIEKYCAEKRAEINKKYEQLVLKVYRSAEVKKSDDEIEKLRLKEEEELAQYTVEFVVAGIALNNFETLPADEQTMLLEASNFQQTAIGKYRVARDKKDDPDLYLTDENVTEIHDISSASLAKDYAEAAEEDEDNNPDAGFYNGELYGIADYNNNSPHFRIKNRQTAIEFLKGRGNQLHPVIRARIYVDIANSLLYEYTRDRDLELAKKFLLKGISLLEEFRSSHSQNFDDLHPFKGDKRIDTILGYACYRYAGLLQEQTKKSTKPDETVCQWYEKTAGRGWSNAGTEIWTSDYVDYLLEFPDTMDRAISVINRHWTEEAPYLTNSATARVLERLRALIEASKTPQALKINSKKFQELKDKLSDDSDNRSYYDSLNDQHNIIENWYGANISSEQRAQKLKLLFHGAEPITTMDDILNHYKNSPITGKDYKFIVEDKSGIEPFNPVILLEKVDKINRIARGSEERRLLLYAHLLDDWAPTGKVDRKKALEFYRKALAQREELDNDEIADAIARCYRILNAPQSYGAGEYFMANVYIPDINDITDIGDTTNTNIDNVTDIGDITEIGERVTWNNDEDKQRYEIEDPKDNLVALFYDKEQNIGIMVNRYIDVAAWSTAYNKSDYLKIIAKRKQLEKEADDLEQKNQPTTEIDSRITKLDEEITEFEKKLTPEGIGDIYYFRIGSKGMEINSVTVYHVKQKKQEHLEYLENPQHAGAVNAQDFPFEGFSAATMLLYRDFHNLRGRRKPPDNGWVPITDDEGKYLYLDSDNNIIQVDPEIHDRHEK